MRWKINAARTSNVQNGTRRVFLAMLMLADWKGRLTATEQEIGATAGVCARQVRRELPRLFKSGDVILARKGKGRRPHSYHLNLPYPP